MGDEARAARAEGQNPRRIPGPGHFGLIDTVRFVRDPVGTLQRVVRAYGDPFSGSNNEGVFVFTGHPEGVRAVFTANPDMYDIPMRRQAEPFFGATSLLLTSGPRHRADRKLLAPPFHGARMRAYGRAIVEIAEAAAARWVPGDSFVMMEATQAISLEVILRVVFGVESDERRERFREAIVELMAATASPLITLFEFSRREFAGVGPWARFARARARFDALVHEEIAARRASSAAGEDILSLMMSARYDDGAAMTDSELRDQLHLLLFAGHDTTSTALAWAFYWLHRQPAERARLFTEIDALGPTAEPEAIAALPYLDAVCNETLRIHPVVMNVARLLTAPLEVRGYTVPAGTTMQVSILLLHNDEALYPEPRVFRPERFLERKFAPYEFIPFGGGARRCLGAAMAMYEMKLVLATLLRGRRLRLVRDVEVSAEIRGLTMGPRGGIPMIYEGPRAG